MNEVYKIELTINGSLSDVAEVRNCLGNKLLSISISSSYWDNGQLHETQLKLLSLIEKVGIKQVEAYKLRQVGELIGVEHPQKIKHHIEQLKKRGLWNDDIKPTTGEDGKDGEL